MIATQKITFNLPIELKEEVVKLKDTLHVSLNTIYKTAIIEYLERQEVKRWEDGAKKASLNDTYKSSTQELANTGTELYEY